MISQPWWINANALEISVIGTLLKPAVESAYTEAKSTLMPSSAYGLLTPQIFQGNHFDGH